MPVKSRRPISRSSGQEPRFAQARCLHLVLEMLSSKQDSNTLTCRVWRDSSRQRAFPSPAEAAAQLQR